MTKPHPRLQQTYIPPPEREPWLVWVLDVLAGAGFIILLPATGVGLLVIAEALWHT